MDLDLETKLVEAAQNGHLESFGILYKCYHSSMVALAYSILTDRESAEDVAQEVFAIACSDMGNLKSKDKFAAWLAGICRNISRQMLRTNTKKIELKASEPADRDNHQVYCKEILQQAVQNLQPAEKELIVLRYYDNLPYEQIAKILDVSVQAVNGRLIRTKRKIAEYLKRNGLTGDDYETP